MVDQSRLLAIARRVDRSAPHSRPAAFVGRGAWGIMGTAKKIRTPDEWALASVMPAVSVDETREHICKPFGRAMNGRGYLIGTDGHRLHAVAATPEAWQAHNRDAEPFPPPPAEQVIPWEAPWVGEFNAAALDDVRCFSTRWDVSLECGPGGSQKLFASVLKGSGKKAARMYPFGRDGVPVSLFKLEQLTFTFAVSLPYLLDAVDCVGAYGSVHVWSKHDKKFPGLDPIVFTHTSKPLREQDRIALVMPRRV